MIIVHKSIFMNFFICGSSVWWLCVSMVCVTALDIQVSLHNQMANWGGLFSNMASCDNILFV